ncbi:ADP-forming succinate--CoA ligase subunit beta [Candidatus Ishikawella capsulata]|uniref:Succinate--CoA ligase [ADP-forming] subunit beta n=1 Tax=Candidatus Ishikawaella capsulata Mpkobe TaxID=476281 RepID=C5WDC8_9ENTR|nr:ADP-forming succinate--CoA ligase subunit beta [Candidatus Ishikawaella capsulata]BAH83334.1 succinyl-CoA synthetase subunit beta [Candidatus Ishikawaella capsulata Mpkobe]
MNLHEYQTKNLFFKYGLPIPLGYVCTKNINIEKAILKSGEGPWVVKCQIHAGGRGKAGGVKLINSKYEVHEFIKNWLGKYLVTNQTDNKGKPVNHILVEEAINIDKELYLAAVIDRNNHRVVILASMEGGVEIEKNTQKIHKISLDLLTGPLPYQARELAFKLELKDQQINQFTKIFISISNMLLKYDLEIIEINPLVVNNHGYLVCLDGKINIDNNALYRQPEIYKMCDLNQEDILEVRAKNRKLNYVALEGNIGCIVNGAGLAMATMDMLKHYGGQPANFLDIGGDTTHDRVVEAFKIILSEKNIKVIFINIFGGIVRCDLIAKGIISAVKEIEVSVPIIVRLEGNNASIGIQNIINSHLDIIAVNSLIDAIKLVILTAEGKHVDLN